MSYAEVAVNSSGAQRRTFSYAVPPHLPVSPGQGVWVPFGPRILQGIVFQLTQLPAVEETREIQGVIDSHPLLTLPQLKLADWMSQRYLAPLFECAALMLPPGFEQKLLTFVELTSSPMKITSASLTSKQRELLHFLEGKGRGAMEEVEKALGKKEAPKVVAQLVRRGLVVRSQELQKPRVKPVDVPYVRLKVEAGIARREAGLLSLRAPQQAALLQLLAEANQALPLSQIRSLLSSASQAVASLARRGLVSVERIPFLRDPLKHRVFAPSVPPQLTPDQEAVWRQIQAGWEVARGDRAVVFLLYGVTGSGKTEIYLRALAEAVSRHRRGIVLVPEIALTPQTIERFASRFPGRVAVLHSKLSLGEQYDQWYQIRAGLYDVVIGSRGATFAPQKDLGLVVIDEEHEWTYKQQDVPRYHAREVALKLAELYGAVLILGSATPDVESFHRAQRGDYKLLELPQRITLRGESALPEVEVVDLRQELKGGNTSLFSHSLRTAVSQALVEREQVILFLNRRGTATFVQCRNCGFVYRCSRCSLSLTYHFLERELVCHQCYRRKAIPRLCAQCGSQSIKFLGTGTEKVEAETAVAFPGARILRWDRDVTRGKYSHEIILGKFRAHEADILIGTQMIAKGLDLPLVTVVGIISADTALHLPDFRAAERTFQVVSQVAGRAGRGERRGKVIVQTFSPQHYAVIAAAKQDYAAFYHQEISYRQEYENPPFSALARLVYAHSNPELCQQEAERMRLRLEEELLARGIPGVALVGPSPAFFYRVRGRFRWQIILKGSQLWAWLAELPLPQGWSVDIDPIGLV